MRWTLALATILLAGCATPSATVDEAAPQPVPVEEWRRTLSEPRFDGAVSSLVRIAAADGTSLSMTVHLPDGLPEGETVPTLLQITPYQPLSLRQSSPQGTTGPGGWWAFYVERGAAYVEADARGTGGSAGCLDFGGAADRSDAASFVAWIREQPWSNGVVVTDGVSHPGMGSVVAHAAVADLTAALTHAPVVDYWRDEWYQGAKFDTQFNGPAYQAIELVPPLYAEPEAVVSQVDPCVGRTTLDFEQPDGTHGDLWDERDLARHVDNARAPILLTQGFVDQNVHPDHVQAYWDALPPDFLKYVVWGWWYHGWPDMEGHPAEDFDDVRHRWLDATLLDIDNGLWNEPRVLVEDSLGTWHVGDEWPLEPSQWVRLNASPEGSLAEGASAEGTLMYEDKLGAKRRFWTDASAVFRTEPFEAAKLVNGAPRVTLAASSNVESTKWVVYLLDEAPDGTWQRVTHGYADSHTWESEDTWRAMEPGTEYTWTITLMPTATVIEEGHRLALLIASSDDGVTADMDSCFDDHRGGCYSPSGIRPAETHGRAVNSVHTGPEGTYVELAWVDPALTRKA